MDFDSFLASPRWEILKIIAETPTSPVEIAKKLNTTVSYISQQLKLLDAAGIVTKKRTGAYERGKPRMLFSISKDMLYLTALTTDFSSKKLLYVQDYHKIILKIWTLDNPALHYYVEKFFWKIEDDLDDIEGIFVETIDILPKIIVVSESKKLKSKIESFIKKFDKKLDYLLVSKTQFKKVITENLISLHDSNDFLKKMKGGNNLNNG